MKLFKSLYGRWSDQNHTNQGTDLSSLSPLPWVTPKSSGPPDNCYNSDFTDPGLAWFPLPASGAPTAANFISSGFAFGWNSNIGASASPGFEETFSSEFAEYIDYSPRVVTGVSLYIACLQINQRETKACVTIRLRRAETDSQVVVPGETITETDPVPVQTMASILGAVSGTLNIGFANPVEVGSRPYFIALEMSNFGNFAARGTPVDVQFGLYLRDDRRSSGFLQGSISKSWSRIGSTTSGMRPCGTDTTLTSEPPIDTSVSSNPENPVTESSPGGLSPTPTLDAPRGPNPVSTLTLTVKLEAATVPSRSTPDRITPAKILDDGCLNPTGSGAQNCSFYDQKQQWHTKNALNGQGWVPGRCDQQKQRSSLGKTKADQSVTKMVECIDYVLGPKMVEYVDYALGPVLKGASLYVGHLRSTPVNPRATLTVFLVEAVSVDDRPQPGEIFYTNRDVPVIDILEHIPGVGVVDILFDRLVEVGDRPFFMGLEIDSFAEYVSKNSVDQFAMNTTRDAVNRCFVEMADGSYLGLDQYYGNGDRYSMGLRPILDLSDGEIAKSSIRSSQEETGAPVTETRSPPLLVRASQTTNPGNDQQGETLLVHRDERDPHQFMSDGPSLARQDATLSLSDDHRVRANDQCHPESDHPTSNDTVLAIHQLRAINVSRNGSSDGSILVEASGGMPPYGYRLSGAKDISSGSGCFTGLGAGTYTVSATDQRGRTVSETVIIGVICFTRDSYVSTDQGVVRVDRLKPTHTVHGERVALVCSGSIPRGSELIEVRPGAFGQGRPYQSLFLTPNHRIMISGRLLQAGQLARGDKVGGRLKTISLSRPVEVFNVLMPKYTTILVNGLEIESLHPDSGAAKLYGSKRQAAT
jgi:hypothetical protein